MQFEDITLDIIRTDDKQLEVQPLYKPKEMFSKTFMGSVYWARLSRFQSAYCIYFSRNVRYNPFRRAHF